MRRYRVNASVGDLRHGELIDIDDGHSYWQGLIAAKTISLVPEVKPLVPSPGASKPRPADPVPERVPEPEPSEPAQRSDDLELREQIRRAFDADPAPTTADVADRFGVSRSYASKVRRGAL